MKHYLLTQTLFNNPLNLMTNHNHDQTTSLHKGCLAQGCDGIHDALSIGRLLSQGDHVLLQCLPEDYHSQDLLSTLIDRYIDSYSYNK